MTRRDAMRCENEEVAGDGLRRRARGGCPVPGIRNRTVFPVQIPLGIPLGIPLEPNAILQWRHTFPDVSLAWGHQHSCMTCIQQHVPGRHSSSAAARHDLGGTACHVSSPIFLHASSAPRPPLTTPAQNWTTRSSAERYSVGSRSLTHRYARQCKVNSRTLRSKT